MLKIIQTKIIILSLCLLVAVAGAFDVYYFVTHPTALPANTPSNEVVQIVNGTSGGTIVETNNTTTTNSTALPTPAPKPETKKPEPEHFTEALKATSKLTYTAWDWQEGVALQGLVNYAAISGNKDAQDSALQKFTILFPKAPKNMQDVLLANQVILGEASLASYHTIKDTKYLDTAKMLSAALLSWSAVAPNGAFLHYYEKYCPKCDNKNYVWADTLYMTVPFLVKIYQETGDSRYIHKASSQMLLHAEYLQDANGLIRHASKTDGKPNEFMFWGRANGWFAASTADVLGALPASDPDRKKLIAIFQKQMQALASHESKNFLWHTVIDHSETYEESSATALIDYAMLKGVRIGVLDKLYYSRAINTYQAIQNQVAASGVLKNVSAGTSPSAQLADYTSIPHSEAQLYGQGAYFNVLSEWYRLQTQ